MTGKMISITGGKPPTAKALKRLRVLDRLAADADMLVERHDEMWQAQQQVWRDAHKLTKGEPSDELPNVDLLNADDEDLLAACRAALSALDSGDNYDADGDLKRDIISGRLAGLVGAFPNGAPATPEVFVRSLLEHVAAIENLKLVELDSACQAIAQTKKFLPAISEVLDTVHEKRALWRKRLNAMQLIEARSRELAESFAELKPRWQASAALRKERQARRDLEAALAQRAAFVAAAITRQQEAARAAQQVEAALARLAASEAELATAARALEEALAEAKL
jgi:hypothetical protein